MDRFNRLVVVVLLLLALPVCTIALAIPAEAVRFVDGLGAVLATSIAGPDVSLLEAAQSITIPGRVLLALTAIAVDLGIGLLLFYELRRPRSGFLVRARGSKADVSPESIQAQVMHHVSQIEGVLDLDVRVQPMTGGRVDLTLDVLTLPDVMVAKKVKEITGVVRQVVVKHMGLRLGEGPSIHLELASPSAVAHAEDLVRQPVPLEAPLEPVAALPAAEAANPARPGENSVARDGAAENSAAVVNEETDNPVAPG